MPHLGRWASPDPLQIHAGGGGEFGNSYHYVSGNLLQATDPTGLGDEPIVVETNQRPGDAEFSVWVEDPNEQLPKHANEVATTEEAVLAYAGKHDLVVYRYNEDADFDLREARVEAIRQWAMREVDEAFANRLAGRYTALNSLSDATETTAEYAGAGALGGVVGLVAQAAADATRAAAEASGADEEDAATAAAVVAVTVGLLSAARALRPAAARAAPTGGTGDRVDFDAVLRSGPRARPIPPGPTPSAAPTLGERARTAATNTHLRLLRSAPGRFVEGFGAGLAESTSNAGNPVPTVSEGRATELGRALGTVVGTIINGQ